MASQPLPDYLKTPHGSTPSFHFRVGERPHVAAPAKPEQPANEFGYPRPGVQSPSPYSATAPHYFVNEATWQAILDHGDFDDVVVGSGHCGLAYVDEALKRDPASGVLRKEVGRKWDAVTLTEEQRDAFEEDGRRCWEELERLRVAWEAALGWEA